ncbi:MAG: hypothetical protein K9N46_09885 [Candidatus Marinimicrobia bacterium]|nr:hypothetical protein [Candidatus Neomarinimicrobiota bacterium]MCF7828373.1 hypothetical protein [Candidatus Neomarinimicrobiota bacterium]MCF7881033.1 hypothetical protein [Candidatus Neomarinimicrobiota bacterium]
MLKWFPWKYLIRVIARRHGFLDPIGFLAKLRQFAQPSEVSEPIELLRAGALFHARGLINARTIQQNLDWIWPYWVNNQFDPQSSSFQPRAFSFSHVNLTHRNWTAVGLPGSDAYPVVDPRGLVTPLWDGWSLDAWLIPANGDNLIPAEMDDDVDQHLDFSGGLAIRTASRTEQHSLGSNVRMELEDDKPVCRIQYDGISDSGGWLAIGLRPYNPEGVSFINDIELNDHRRSITVNEKTAVHFSEPVERHLSSRYKDGDVFRRLPDGTESTEVSCDVGMANSASLFELQPGKDRTVSVSINLEDDPEVKERDHSHVYQTWEESLVGTAELQVPDDHLKFLYDAALRSVIMLSPDWTYPGPYTYKRFWYRDAVFIVNALLASNATEKARQILDHFPEKQNVWGYFHSQEGEWDSNGEALWAFAKYCELTGETPPDEWLKSIVKGGKWIARKRTSKNSDALHAGLLPSGFSAEHFGNIDYYYWDDYWSVGGLRSASRLLSHNGMDSEAAEFLAEADDFMETINRTLEKSESVREHPGIPASPHRRMDAGAIGSVVAGYPLQLLPPDDESLLATIDFLEETSFQHGAFFQEMVHSGMNAYLTLHMAQVLLRAGDRRYQSMVEAVAELASPTGQWPEAIHPHTLGGCMGDGQHGWAAAEWIVMIRNMFVREEDSRLILGSGIFPEWLESEATIRFGPTPTPFGNITVSIDSDEGARIVHWDADWRNKPNTLEVSLPGAPPETIQNPTETGFVEVPAVTA